MKKVKDWYMLLPKNVRKKAFANTSAEKLERMENDLKESLRGSFVFEDAPEGGEFWGKFVYYLDDEWLVKYSENEEEKERLFKDKSEAFEFYEKTPYPKAFWDHRRMELLDCIDENGEDYC